MPTWNYTTVHVRGRLSVAEDPETVRGIVERLTSIHEALRSSGRLVIIEFRPDGPVGRVTRMGVDPAALIEAVTAAGFEVVTTEEWPGWDHYVAVFEKSAAGGPRTER